jgi:hypothetical protein
VIGNIAFVSKSIGATLPNPAARKAGNKIVNEKPVQWFRCWIITL